MEEAERYYMFSDNSQGQYDVAAANLAAAAGLPGADGLDAGSALSWLDEAARRVNIETLRHSYQFREWPQEFENSAAYFCMLVMATVLCKDFGVRYNPERIRDPKFQDPNCFDPDFSDSRDLFIHGLIDGPGGTCASMPVLYAAVGRRLNYPLRLVQSKGHLFVRWDDPEGKAGPPARFNVEATGQGLACPPDEHYRIWPVPLTDGELASGLFLRAMTPREEVAGFRAVRGDCLWENGRYADAMREYNWSVTLAPHDQRYSWLVMESYKKFRGIIATMPPEEARPLLMPRDEVFAIQEGILRGHLALVAEGKPGNNLAEYGIRDVAMPHGGDPVHRRMTHPMPSARPTASVSSQAERMNEFNRRN